jgi:hypothetical protein
MFHDFIAFHERGKRNYEQKRTTKEEKEYKFVQQESTRTLVCGFEAEHV